MTYGLRYLLLSCLFLVIYAAQASEEHTPIDTKSYRHWMFMGIVTNENGEDYGFVFQMQKLYAGLHANVAIIDQQSKKVIDQEESWVALKDEEPNHWRAGRAFLRFNPINNNWIFGLQPKDKNGFNFKIDMLRQSFNPAPLRQGIELWVTTTGHLNGHVQFGQDHHEQFVTAKNTWFWQLDYHHEQDKDHPFKGVACQFLDGSGFYAINMNEYDAIRGALAGWFTEQGVPKTISQFVKINDCENEACHIKLTEPHLHLVLQEYLKQSSIIAGFVAKGQKEGFCILNNEHIGKVQHPLTEIV